MRSSLCSPEARSRARTGKVLEVFDGSKSRADRERTRVARFWVFFDGLPLLWALLLYVLSWPILEMLWAYRTERYLRVRSAQRVPHDERDTAAVLHFWDLLLSDCDCRELKEIANGWFLGEGELHRDNLNDLISWTLYSLPASALDEQQRQVADGIVERAQKAIVRGGLPVPDGRNEALRCMTHTIDALPSCWKPLFFYLCWRIARDLGDCLLRLVGFHLCQEGGLEYWHHPASRQPRSLGTALAAPLVVLHGVGGLWPYVPMLLQVVITPNLICFRMC